MKRVMGGRVWLIVCGIPASSSGGSNTSSMSNKENDLSVTPGDNTSPISVTPYSLGLFKVRDVIFSQT